MSKFYVAFASMQQLSSVLSREQEVELPDLLAVLCACRELSESMLRVSEKRVLNTLNKSKNGDTIRFPLQEKVNSAEMKVCVLLQAALGVLPIPDPSLSHEATHLVKLAQRLATCLVELVMHHSQAKANLALVTNSYLLLKSLTCGLWENSGHVIKQMPGLVLF